MAENESSMNTKVAYIQSQYFTAPCISTRPIVMDWTGPFQIPTLRPWPSMWLPEDRSFREVIKAKWD